MRSVVVLLALSSLAAFGCKKEPPPEAASAPPPSPPTGLHTNAAESNGQPLVVSGTAEVGKPAPDFTLKDLDGKETHLAQLKGAVVVLEWFNPGCPFVNRAHTKGSLRDAPAKHLREGVVWLAVNSAAAGKQGAGADANRDAAKAYGMSYPILLDDTGAVGKAYGATNTPHMFVIDAKGTLLYRGAIDNSPDGEGESAPDGKLVSYVDAALASIASGQPVAVSETKAYGCGVKYAH